MIMGNSSDVSLARTQITLSAQCPDAGTTTIEEKTARLNARSTPGVLEEQFSAYQWECQPSLWHKALTCNRAV